MILGDNLYDAMRYTPCKRRASLLACPHVTSSPRSTPIAGCMKGLVVCTPSMPRPTGRAILAGPCSEPRSVSPLAFHDAEFAARQRLRAAESADQRSGLLRQRALRLATMHSMGDGHELRSGNGKAQEGLGG